MSDIVERLRLLQSGAAWVCGETAATLEDAADEIERLRLEANGLLDGNLAIWAAHNRLREALREIARMETIRANATVGRMAAKAQAALGDG
jgi:hypothetical protein